MSKCEKCGSASFRATMATTAEVLISTETGVPVAQSDPERIISTEYIGCFVCVNCGAVQNDVEDIDDSDLLDVRRCSCGNTRFFANQLCYHEVVVDSANIFAQNIAISDSGHPYGPYCCTKCGAEYETLDELEGLSVAR